MSKMINLLNQARNMRDSAYAISTNEANFTVYEPFNKVAPRNEMHNSDFEQKPQTNARVSKTFFSLSIIMGVVVVAFSYMIAVNTQKELATMNDSYKALASTNTVLVEEITQLKATLKDNSITAAFKINSLEQKINEDHAQNAVTQERLVNRIQVLEDNLKNQQLIAKDIQIVN